MKTRRTPPALRRVLAMVVLATALPALAQSPPPQLPDLKQASVALPRALNLSGDRAARVSSIEGDAAKSVRESRVAAGLDHARFARDLTAIERERDERLRALLDVVEFAHYLAWRRDRLAAATAQVMRDALGISEEQAGRVTEIQKKALDDVAAIPTTKADVDRQADLRAIEKARMTALAAALGPEQMKAYRSSRDAIRDEARARLVAGQD